MEREPRGLRRALVACLSLVLLCCGGGESTDLFSPSSTGTGTSGAAGSARSGTGAGGDAGSGNAGSGGASTTGGASGSGGASAGAGSSGAGGRGIDASIGIDGSTTIDARLDRDRLGDAGCPNVLGDYRITSVSGDCSNLSESAPQRIEGGTVQSCVVQFRSVTVDTPPGVNGMATLGPDGSFMGPLSVGTASRRDCKGTWDPNGQVMTIACSGSGGPGGDCTIRMTRR
jgi:hypothetical protein